MKDDSPRNIYQMWFEDGGNTTGLWITRLTWSTMVAYISQVGEAKGPAPYYGNPKVHADLYNLDGSVRQRDAEVSAAGTYKTYRRIEPPSWADRHE